MINNPYISQRNNIWYCMLPNRCYKEVPYINWVENINWSVIYYKVYQGLIQEKLTYKQMQEWPIEKILEAVDVRI